MVKSIYFLKPAWCGIHPAGLGPDQDLQSARRATAFRRWFLTFISRLHLGGVNVPARKTDQRHTLELSVGVLQNAL
jgi:hypothetical protein